MNRSAFGLLLLYFLFPLAIFSQSDIQQLLDDWSAHPALSGAGMGLVVLDVASGKVMGAKNPAMGLSPASSLKVLTTAAALDILGKDHRYQTELKYSGELVDGVLHGDIWIVGGGDPSLGGNRFGEGNMLEILDRWVNNIRAAGIEKIDGAIVGDGDYFKGVRAGRGWPFEDIGNYYGAGVWGLNLQENLFYLDFKLQRDTRKPPILMAHRPAVPHLTIINELSTGNAGSGDQAYIFGGPYNYNRFIRGSLPAGDRLFTIKGSVPDAPYFAAYHLKEALEKKGIDTKRATTWIDHPPLRRATQSLGSIQSANLQELVEACNHESINLYAEAFLRSIGGAQRSEQSGLAALKAWMKRKGLPLRHTLLMDGSGLSPQNRISAMALAKTVQLFAKEPAFFQSLPVGNTNGTAKYLFDGEPNAQLIRVKSGYIEGVRSYTGIATSISGRQYAFCFLLNNFACNQSEARNLLQDLMIQLTSIE